MSDKNDTLVVVNCDENDKFCRDDNNQYHVIGYPGVAVMRNKQILGAQIILKNLDNIKDFYKQVKQKYIDQSNTFNTISEAQLAFKDDDCFFIIYGDEFIAHAQEYEIFYKAAYVPTQNKSKLYLVYNQQMILYNQKVFSSVIHFVSYFTKPWFQKYNSQNISHSQNKYGEQVLILVRENKHLHDMKMLTLFFESFKLNLIKLHNQTAVNYLVLLENYNLGFVDVQENIKLLNGYNFMRAAMFQPVFLINYSSQNCYRRKVLNLSKYIVKQTNSYELTTINNKQIRSQIQYTVFKNGSGTINSDFYIPAFVDELIEFLAQMQNFQTCEPKTKQRFDFVLRILNAEIKIQKGIVFFGAVLAFALIFVIIIVFKFT
ncbi:Hypothetical_protein [Hexamita inflata]|uniref:Hypothetical_protein n=1 Tax=Hexamita inflata TaxID=28002 RepID=A0AA86NGH7_9EUKA|nr:Hypothetical protein HINF_LOCUS6969 [Hexamita inflata]